MAGEGPAALVERLDPGLFRTALFAAEPGRGRLLTLYAFDVEVARAARAGHGTEVAPLVSAMRLQWWRDVVSAAEEGAPPAHEVAGPLAELVAAAPLPTSRLHSLIDGHAREDAAPLDLRAFEAWAGERFGARTALALACLGGAEPPEAVLRGAALALGADLAVRSARGMAGEGRALLPGLSPADLSALAEGQATEAAAAAARRVAERALAALSEARGTRWPAPRGTAAALLPLWEAERACRTVAEAPEHVAEGVPPPNPARRALALAVRAARGRW